MLQQCSKKPGSIESDHNTIVASVIKYPFGNGSRDGVYEPPKLERRMIEHSSIIFDNMAVHRYHNGFYQCSVTSSLAVRQQVFRTFQDERIKATAHRVTEIAGFFEFE